MKGRKAVVSIQAVLTHKGTKVITALATETVMRAADRMTEHGIAALVVKNGDTVVGVISDAKSYMPFRATERGRYPCPCAT
jgi:CBS domain-containing protein